MFVCALALIFSSRFPKALTVFSLLALSFCCQLLFSRVSEVGEQFSFVMSILAIFLTVCFAFRSPDTHQEIT